MKSCVAVVALLLSTLALSCTPDQPATADPAGNPAPVSQQHAAVPDSASSAGQPSKPAVSAPPADAHYTLFCASVTGPNHVAEAEQLKSVWQKATHSNQWYIIHGEASSDLYFGYYRSISDQSDPDARRALTDRKRITSLQNSVGDPVFASALLVPLDSPDPDAPPQWNLVNVDREKPASDPTRAFWSLEIASYNDPVQRKSAAVESVRAARAQGIEAYYYHGPSVSSVCIGTWPASSVKAENDTTVNSGDQALFVVPGNVDEQIKDKRNGLRDRDGNPLKVLSDGLVIVDPSLVEATRKYPYHSLNGYEDNMMQNGAPVPRPSGLVVIPREKAGLLSRGDAPDTTERPAVDLLGGLKMNGDTAAANGPRPSDAGKLRSVGE